MTRDQQHYPTLRRIVESHGAIAVSLPCLAIEIMQQSIANGMRLLVDCSDILFTSASGVHAVVSVMADGGRSLGDVLHDRRIAAVGKKTAAALSQLDVRVDIVPETASQDGLIEAYAANGLPESLLFFRAEKGRDALANTLLEQGVKVITIPAYRSVCPSGDASDIMMMFENCEIDAVLLGSAQTAAHYLQRMGSPVLANRPVIVAISEKMASAVRHLGLNVQVVAKEASFEAMLDALAEYFDSRSL